MPQGDSTRRLAVDKCPGVGAAPQAMSDPQSIEAQVLRTRLAELGFACAWAGAAESGGLLREAAVLLAADGQPVSLSAGALEALIAGGGHDAAALALIEHCAGYMLSHAPGGRFLATVVLAGRNGETSAEGETAAMALIGALASALAERDQPSAEPAGAIPSAMGSALLN